MPEPNFQNRTLYHGDNLEFLRGMNSETVHLIATDPPFNKNRDFYATPDSLASGARFKDRWRWDEDVHEEWTDSIIDDWPAVWEVITAARAAYGDDMGAFLCWLGVRLMEMRRVLRQDGSIYLHIDHTAHAYVKCMMDGIFGSKNFRNEIVWCYTGPSNTKRWYPRKHDTLLFYTKGTEWTFNADDVRIPYKQLNIQHRNQGGGGIGGNLTPDNVDKYRNKGKIPEDYWLEDRDEMTPVGRLKNERTGFPTQKPLSLYRRIIAASSNEDDIVLDPFCGCATTPVAAEQLKRRWVGMDIWDGAEEAVKSQLRKFWLFTPEESQKMMFPHQITILTDPPVRSDDNEVAALELKLKIQRPVADWEKLTHKQMVCVLAQAQGSSDGVICAGCGRVLEVEFMQLDHISPKTDGGANHILNRVLLCGPCNRRKRNRLTLSGLVADNRKKSVGWMKDEARATMARQKAREQADWVRDNFGSAECKALIEGRGAIL